MQFQIKFNIIVLALFFMPLMSRAQESTEFFSLSYSQVPASDFSKSPGNTAVANLEAYLITPTIKLGKKTNLNNIFTYKLADYNFNQTGQDGRGYPKKLTDIQYSLLLRQGLNEHWSLFVLPQVIVRSDFEHNFTGNDLFPALSVLAVHSSRNYKKLDIGYGLSYSRDYTKNTISPVFAITYITSQFRLDALLPVRVEFVLTPGQFWEYGLEVNFNTAIYRTDMPDPDIKYIRSINLPICAGLARKIYGMLWVKAKAGMTLSRQYDVLDGDYHVIKNQANEINPSAYAIFGISLRSKN